MKSFGDIRKNKEIPWVRHWIDDTYEFSRNFLKKDGKIDFEALGKEEWEFRKALKLKDFSKNERAKFVWEEANSLHERNRSNGLKRGKKNEFPEKSVIPEDFQEVIDWCNDNGYGKDIDIARMIWDMAKERGGLDEDGKKILNWWGYMLQCVKTRKENIEKEERDG